MWFTFLFVCATISGLVATLIKNKKWFWLVAYVISMGVIVISWYWNILVPAVNNSMMIPFTLSYFDIAAAVLVWPTAIFSMVVVYRAVKALRHQNTTNN